MLLSGKKEMISCPAPKPQKKRMRSRHRFHSCRKITSVSYRGAKNTTGNCLGLFAVPLMNGWISTRTIQCYSDRCRDLHKDAIDSLWHVLGLGVSYNILHAIFHHSLPNNEYPNHRISMKITISMMSEKVISITPCHQEHS